MIKTITKIFLFMALLGMMLTACGEADWDEFPVHVQMQAVVTGTVAVSDKFYTPDEWTQEILERPGIYSSTTAGAGVANLKGSNTLYTLTCTTEGESDKVVFTIQATTARPDYILQRKYLEELRTALSNWMKDYYAGEITSLTDSIVVNKTIMITY